MENALHFVRTNKCCRLHKLQASIKSYLEFLFQTVRNNRKFPLFRDIVLRLYFPPLVATRTGHDGKPKKVRILLSTGKETLLPASEDKLLKETIYFSD